MTYWRLSNYSTDVLIVKGEVKFGNNLRFLIFKCWSTDKVTDKRINKRSVYENASVRPTLKSLGRYTFDYKVECTTSEILLYGQNRSSKAFYIPPTLAWTWVPQLEQVIVPLCKVSRQLGQLIRLLRCSNLGSCGSTIMDDVLSYISPLSVCAITTNINLWGK